MHNAIKDRKAQPMSFDAQKEIMELQDTSGLPNYLKVRSDIDRLETEMKKHEQLDLPPRHYFANGLYAREIFIPKGTLLTGKIHKREHLNIISQGDISVMTEDGVKRIVAPFTMVSRPGMKRVGYAHEDTVWTTIHATDETDLGKIEAAMIATTYEDVGVIESETILKLKEE